jgi:carbamoyltransferase
MSTAILGINYRHEPHDTAAALVVDGRVVFAAAEERFTRSKKDNSFPRLAIQAALDHAGIHFTDLDAIAFGWNRPGLTPAHAMRQSLLGRLPRSRSWTLGQLWRMAIDLLRHRGGVADLVERFGPVPVDRVTFIDHHDAHAWSAYALSGFDEALVLVVDGRGAWQSTTIYHAQGQALRRLRVLAYPNSLGTFYESFTDLLGFQRHNDEWKVMGLAAYGQPTHDLTDLLRVTQTGYVADGRRLSGRRWDDLSFLVSRFGPRRDPETFISADDENLAASVQQATEQALLALVREGVRLTGCRNLCLAGGVAMNSKANGRLLASGAIDDIFVQPAATDDGTAVGAALAVHLRLRKDVPRYELEDVYLGPEVTDAQVRQAVTAYKLPAVQVPDVAGMTARLLAAGHIVGWFQGRMEFGPRALGNRSILADARDPAMKDRVNECIKFREGWRPFAPSCLAERAHEYFSPAHASPFMILTFDVNPEKRSVIPAVTHADNSARVQTVRRDVNRRYWELIAAFDRLTGVPVVMNTSFNLRGEPIVCTPKDAVRTFYSSGMDFLVLGDHVIAKDPALQAALAEQPQPVAAGG